MSPSAADPWSLPGLGRWLGRIVDRLDQHGLVVLPCDPGRPPAVAEALNAASSRHFHTRRISAGSAIPPAAQLAEHFGVASTLEGLCVAALDQDLVILDLADAESATLSGWGAFLRRLHQARVGGRQGLALLVVDAPPGLELPPAIGVEPWRRALRRGDLAIWAEEQLPSGRDGLVAEFAVSLAMHLCGWRLDLAAALVTAGIDDLVDPLAWLGRRNETAVPGGEPACPLAATPQERNRRIWQAQLTTLFPALESWRLAFVERHRSRLRLDEHLRRLGVATIEEMEFGALRFQLSDCVTRTEAEQLSLRTRARNALAHRQMVDPADLRALLMSKATTL